MSSYRFPAKPGREPGSEEQSERTERAAECTEGSNQTDRSDRSDQSDKVAEEQQSELAAGNDRSDRSDCVNRAEHVKRTEQSKGRVGARPSGGYRQLRSFQAATIVYDATVSFCERFVDRRSRWSIRWCRRLVADGRISPRVAGPGNIEPD